MDFLIEFMYFFFLDLFYIFPFQGRSVQGVERGAAPWLPPRKSFPSDLNLLLAKHWIYSDSPRSGATPLSSPMSRPPRTTRCRLWPRPSRPCG